MSDVHHITRWKEELASDPIMCPHGDLLVFEFSADGVPPMKRKSYSMWPVALCCYNVPAHMRMTLPALWVSMIVPPYGSKHGEANDFQPFFEVMMDDLNYQYVAGTEVGDSLYGYREYCQHSLACMSVDVKEHSGDVVRVRHYGAVRDCSYGIVMLRLIFVCSHALHSSFCDGLTASHIQ